MKTKILIPFVLLALFLTAFTLVSDKRSATVEDREGVYIFMFSKPTAEYEYLGTVKKTGIVWTGEPKEMFNILLRRCKKDYPDADGIIFSDVSLDHADCVKFK